MKKLMLTFFALFCIAVTAWADNAKRDPWVEWRRGYELFREGDNYLRRNQLDEALNAYKRSRDTYKLVLEANTGWNQNLINSKISACETQILKIEKRIRERNKNSQSQQPAAPKQQSVQKPASRTAIADDAEEVSSNSDISSISASDNAAAAQAEEYKKKYFNLYIEVENLRKQLRTQAQSIQNIDILLKEKRLAEEKAATLQLTIDNLKQQLIQPEKDLQDLRKQLIAERMKNEQLVIAHNSDTETVNTLRLEIKNLTSALEAARTKLNDSVSSKNSLENNIDELRSKLAELNNDRKKLQQQIQTFEATVRELRNDKEIAAGEIKKLNSWIDELTKQKGLTGKISDEINAENKNLREKIETLQAKLKTLEARNTENTFKLQEAEQKLNASMQNANTLDTQKKSIENELKNIRELYIREVNTAKLNNAELETLRAELKKTAASLQTYITRNAELTAMLDAKDSIANSYSKKLDALQSESDLKTKEINTLQEIINKADINNTAKRLNNLNAELNKLEQELAQLKQNNRILAEEKQNLLTKINSLQTELNIFRTPKQTSAKTIESLNADFAKLAEEVAQLKQTNRNLTAEKQNLTEEKQNLTAKVNSIQTELNISRTQNTVSNQTVESLNTDLTKLKAEIAQLKQTNRNLSEEKQNLTSEVSSLQAKLDVARISNTASQKTGESLNANLAKLAEEIAQLKQVTRTLSKEKQNLTSEVSTLQAELDVARSSNTASKKAGESLNADLKKLENEIAQLKQTNYSLTVEKQNLLTKINSLQTALTAARTPAPAPASAKIEVPEPIIKTVTKVVYVQSPASDEKYQKLLKAYNDMKNRYDFLSAELESLNKPLADVEVAENEITSDNELASFLGKAAMDAARTGDYVSAAWYFSELKKNDENNAFYNYGYALYSTLSSERSDALKTISNLPSSREKFILAGLIALLDGKKDSAADNLTKAADAKSVSPEIMELYRKEIPLIIGMFDSKGSMKNEISALKKLLSE